MKKNTPVSYIMTKKVVVAHRDNKLSQVKELFLKYNLHHLPVVENAESDRLIGIISAYDILKFYAEKSSNRTELHVQSLEDEFSIDSVMTKNPITIGPDETVKTAAELFLLNKFHALPVVEDGMIRGIVTYDDLVGSMLPELLEA